MEIMMGRVNLLLDNIAYAHHTFSFDKTTQQ